MLQLEAESLFCVLATVIEALRVKSAVYVIASVRGSPRRIGSGLKDKEFAISVPLDPKGQPQSSALPNCHRIAIFAWAYHFHRFQPHASPDIMADIAPEIEAKKHPKALKTVRAITRAGKSCAEILALRMA